MTRKTDLLNYLELVIFHHNATIGEFPSRYCIIRIPMSNIGSSTFNTSFIFTLSFGQIKKLVSIGYHSSPSSYSIIGHRPFDKNFISQHMSIEKFIDDFYSSFFSDLNYNSYSLKF